MSKMTREEKLFKNENEILCHYQDLAKQDNTTKETKDALAKLIGKYESLLNQTRFLTWISGRLERKLQRKNKELHNNNTVLQKAFDDLTKAEAGRSAYAIIYFIAIVLFVLEEFFVDPLINATGGKFGYGILIKLVIVLILKISEGFIEKKITSRDLKLRKKSN